MEVCINKIVDKVNNPESKRQKASSLFQNKPRLSTNLIKGGFKKVGEIRKSLKIVVPRAGIEPARRKPPRDFKSLASTNFATPARM